VENAKMQVDYLHTYSMQVMLYEIDHM